MAKDSGAGVDDDVDQTGSGAPGDGSKDLKDGQADDGDEAVPAKRLKAALANQRTHYENQLGNLRAEFEAFKAGSQKAAPAKSDEPKRYSRADLAAAVKADQITQEQADDVWAKQVQSDATESATRAALEAVERRSQQERIETDLAQYKRLEPDLLDKASETFAKVREEFQDLVRNGSPNSLATERVAIRAVLGPLDKLQAAKSASRAAEHHEESGAGGEGAPRKRGTGKLVDTLSEREKSYYARLIEKGHHKDWKEVEDLLKSHAKPDVRRKAGARV